MVGSLARISVFISVLFGLYVYGFFNQHKGPFHHSFYSKPDVFDKAYKDSEAKPISDQVSGLLVNHHLLAADLIAEVFESAENNSPDTIILLSPNHFDNGRGQIIVSDRDWSTPYGVVEADKELVAKLTEANVANLDYTPYDKEHGVSGIVPFINKSFPRSEIVPVMFKTTVRPQAIDAFVQEIQKHISDVLIVASIDMSHYMSEEESLALDEQTIQILENREIDKVWNLKIDSPASMYALIKLTNGTEFNFLRRSSSAAILQHNKPEDNTSYITGYFK